MKRKIGYLASPFTHKQQIIMDERLSKATDAAIMLLKHDIHVFSPIAYNAHWSRDEYNLPVEWSFWEIYDKNFLDHCDYLIVLIIDGTDQSVGVTAEIEYALEKNKPIVFITMDDLNNPVIINSIKNIEKLC